MVQIEMNSVLLSADGNQYKLLHIGKMQIACVLGKDFPMHLPCQALIAGADINEATITAFIATDKEANGKLTCPHVIFPSPRFYYFRSLNNFFDCCIVTIAVAMATVAHLDLIEDKEQEELIVEFDGCPSLDPMCQQAMALMQMHNAMAPTMHTIIVTMLPTEVAWMGSAGWDGGSIDWMYWRTFSTTL